MTSKKGNSHKAMIKNPQLLQQVELEYEREHPLTLNQKFDLFEQMYQLAVELGHAPSNTHEESLEEVVSLVRTLHGNIPRTPGAYSAGA